MKRVVGVALLVLAVCAGARAEMTTGIDLYKLCVERGSNPAAQIGCYNFVDGAIHVVLLVQKIAPDALPEACMQQRYTDPAEGFVAWANQHPEELSRRAGETFAAALFDSANCQGRLKILR